jgi:uncharacterized Zn finger protein
MDFVAQSLSRHILANTTQEVFYRGVQYAKEGRVKDIRLQGKTLSALIQGSSDYEVEFRQGPKYTKGYCTCPYALNEDYCKHVAALAVSWDFQRSVEAPNDSEIRELALPIEHSSRKNIEDLYRDPLHADLELLAKEEGANASETPHAKIPLVFLLSQTSQQISLGELRSGLQKIERVGNLKQYDKRLCAREVSALLSLLFDTVVKRLEHTNNEEYLDVLTECATFYYNTYLALVDGSDGVWQIPFARIQLMFGELQNRGIAQVQQEKLRLYLKDSITGWGDVFEELKTQY